MDYQFVFTPADVYRTLLALCGLVVAVAGATKIIVDVIAKAKKPEQKQNEKIASLEARVTSLEAKTENMYEFREQAEESMVLTMKALSVMIGHMIYGNHTEELKRTQKEMNDYMTRMAFHTKGEKI